MSQRKELLTISYHTDDDTGMYYVGETDFGIKVAALEDYLKAFGHKGRQDLMLTLTTLICQVNEYYRNQLQSAQCEAKAP